MDIREKIEERRQSVKRKLQGHQKLLNEMKEIQTKNERDAKFLPHLEEAIEKNRILRIFTGRNYSEKTNGEEKNLKDCERSKLWKKRSGKRTNRIPGDHGSIWTGLCTTRKGLKFFKENMFKEIETSYAYHILEEIITRYEGRFTEEGINEPELREKIIEML